MVAPVAFDAVILYVPTAAVDSVPGLLNVTLLMLSPDTSPVTLNALASSVPAVPYILL